MTRIHRIATRRSYTRLEGAAALVTDHSEGIDPARKIDPAGTLANRGTAQA
jgi:hypothetical protein